MGTFAEQGESNGQGPDGGESMGYSEDGNSIDPEQAPDPRPDAAEITGPAGWKYALNSFLEGAFLQADVDTGC